MKSPVYKSLACISLVFILFLITACGEDKAREEAATQALNSSAQNTETPAQKEGMPARPATVGTLSVSASSFGTSSGSQACVAITAKDFKDIVSMQYTMKWDPQVLKYKEVRGFGLPGLGANNFGHQLVAKGLLTYSWFDANVQGVTKPDGVKLYEVCFEVAGKSGSKSSIQFTEEPTIFEISNSASKFLDLKGEQGVVSVQ